MSFNKAYLIFFFFLFFYPAVTSALPLNQFEAFVDSTPGFETLQNTRSSASSTDNEFVYSVSFVDSAINIFQRGPDDRLALIDSIVANEDENTGARTPVSVVLSPDDRHLYVAAVTPQNVTPTVYVYSVDQDSGLLQQIQMYQERGLQSETELLFSDDGQALYVTSINSNSVTVLTRAVNGLLTELQHIDDEDLFRNFDGLISSNPKGMALSPDQEHFYVGLDRFNTSEGIISHFIRDTDTGFLTYANQVDYTQTGLDALGRSESLVISADGNFLYAVDRSEIFEFSINADGSLSFNRVTLVEENDPEIFPSRFYANIALSNNARLAYVSEIVNDALFLFERNSTSGELTFVGAEVDGRDGVTDLRQADRVVLSADNLYAYVGSSFAFTVFNIATDVEIDAELDAVLEPEQDIQLVLTLTNNGPTTAHSITYTGSIDENSTVVSVEAFSNTTECSLSVQEITCFVADLIPDEAEQITVTLTRTESGTIEAAHSVEIAEVDINNENNNYSSSFEFGLVEDPEDEPVEEAPEEASEDDGEGSSGAGSTGHLFVILCFLIFLTRRLRY